MPQRVLPDWWHAERWTKSVKANIESEIGRFGLSVRVGGIRPGRQRRPPSLDKISSAVISAATLTGCVSVSYERGTPVDAAHAPAHLRVHFTIINMIEFSRQLGWAKPLLKRIGRGTTRAEDAQGQPTQSHISPSILIYEDNSTDHFGSVAVAHAPAHLPVCLRREMLLLEQLPPVRHNT